MRGLCFTFLIVIFITCQQQPSEQVIREVKEYTIEQFYENEDVFAGGFSPDENFILATSNKSGIYNAYALPVDGGDPVQLTNSSDESIFAISYFPEDDRILFSSDSGGNEINHIYVRNEDGNTEDLTPWSGVKSEFGGWSRDEKSFYFISNKRDSKFFDLYEMKIQDFSMEMLYENKEGLDVSEISDDKRYLALLKTITTNNSEMYLYDRETGGMKHISEHEGDANYSPQFFDRSNDYLYYMTDEDNEFQYLGSIYF